MPKSILDIKTDLQGALHGTDLSRVSGVDEILYRAAGDLLLDLNLRETKRVAELQNALYDDVYDYVLPSDLKGRAIIDIRPRTNRFLSDNVRARYTKEFDLYKAPHTFTVKDDTGVKTLRIAQPTIPGILLHDCESLTADGAWTAAGGATNLELDDLYLLTGGRALKFDAGVAGGYIELTGSTPRDLSDHEDDAAEFVGIYIPPDQDPTTLSSVNLRWGSASTDYWTATATSNHDTTAFQNGWNLVRIDWPSSATGSPAASAIDYLRLTLVTTATITGIRVDSFYSKLPAVWEIEYYSKYLFRTSAGAWQETVTDDSNYVNLDTETYNLYFDRIMILLAPQLQGKDSSFDLKFYTDHYKEGRKRYVAQNKSEVQRPQSFYYRR